MKRALLAATLSSAVLATACGDKPAPPPPAKAPPPAEPAGPSVAEAQAFVKQTDAELRTLWVTQAKADWARQTDITPEHTAVSAAAGEATMTYLTKAVKAAKQFLPLLGKLDPSDARQLMLLRLAGTPAPNDPAKAKELAKIGADMDDTYGKGKVCDPSDKAQKKCKDLGALEDVLAKSRKPEELLAAWTGWHDTVGKAVRPQYIRFVELANEGARDIGFTDLGEQWRSGYDMTPAEFAAETERLWGEVEPLYKQLHCYTRRKLAAKYGEKLVPPGQPIPAYLLGNMWAQSWGYIYPELEPYKGEVSPDVTPELVKQKYDPIKMVKLAESFFTSLGLDPLPATFWERSMFTKPAGKEAVCHASAWDVEYADDVRIKMCIKTNEEDLITIHHELGHDYYFHYYYTLPVLFQSGANDGFHEAIGDTIALSITPTYLQKVGLLKKVVKNEKADLNRLLYVALDKVAFLPFGLLMDRWRWDVFSGKVAPDAYNKHWWALRTKYQGIAPPTERGEEFFDPGAKYHIPGNTPYMRYFLSFVLQFQFHRALCKAAGFEGPLSECSIYGSKAAGDKLKAMLAMGASKPWPEALYAMTGERQMDAGALLEYFQPLMVWLEKENAGQQCGW